MGDVDLWSLVNDDTALTVNDKWLVHLQVWAQQRSKIMLILPAT